MRRQIFRLLPLSLLLQVTPSLAFASDSSTTSYWNTLSWVHYTVGGVLLVVLGSAVIQLALQGIGRTRILGHGQLITARSRLRLLSGGLVLAAILFPFLATHAPELAGALIVVIAISTMIYRDSSDPHGRSEYAARPPHNP